MRIVDCLSSNGFKEYVNTVMQRYEEFEEQEVKDEAGLNEDHRPVLLQFDMTKAIEDPR